MADENIEIGLEIEPNLASLDSVQEYVASLSVAAGQLKETVQGLGNILPGYTENISDQLDLLRESANSVLKMRESIDKAPSSIDKKERTSEFLESYNTPSKILSDLQNSVSNYEFLLKTVNAKTGNAFSNAIKGNYGEMINALRYVSTSISRDATQTTKQITDAFKRTDVVQKMKSEHPRVFNEKKFDAIAASVIPYVVPQYYRTELYSPPTGKKATNIYDYFPSQYRDIEFSKKPFYKPASSNPRFEQRLNASQQKQLEQFLLHNPKVQNEAVQAGLIHLLNGKMYMNPSATLGHIDALGGKLAELFSYGASGKYGSRIFTDMYGVGGKELHTGFGKKLTDPSLFDSISRLANDPIKSSKEAARQLADFEGFQPGHYTVPKAEFNPQTWKNIGKAGTKLPKRSMEFLTVTTDELLNGKGVLTKRSGEKTTNLISLSNSLMQQAMSTVGGGDKFEHNGYNSNAVFVEMPPELMSRDTPEDIKKSRRKDFHDVLAQGLDLDFDGQNHQYVFTGFNNQYAVLTRRDVKEKIEKDDPRFFYNGADPSKLVTDDYQKFAKSVEATKKLWTDGVSVKDAYGTNFDNTRVFAVDLKGLTGNDGMDLWSDTLVGQGFQGRSLGGKFTAAPFNLEGLKKLYPQNVRENGDFVLPGASISGQDVVIPAGTKDIILEDIGNRKGEYAEEIKAMRDNGATDDEINQKLTDDLKKYGVFAKTNYESATSAAQWIPAQMAQTLNFEGETGKKAADYFEQVYRQRLARYNNADYVKRVVFDGQDVDLTSEEARRKIEESRPAVVRRHERGDLAVPESLMHYEMIAANPFNIMNSLNRAAGISLTEQQEALELKPNEILYGKSRAENMMLGRSPSTLEGNVKVSNKEVQAFVAAAARDAGLDQNAAYLNPLSHVLDQLGSADFDGDIVALLNLDENKDFGNVLLPVLENTTKRNEAILNSVKDASSPEFIESRKVKKTKDGKTYGLNDINDLIEAQEAHSESVDGMGFANQVNIDAWQNLRNYRIQKGLINGANHYDVASTFYKSAIDWKPTPEEYEILRLGYAEHNLSNWAAKMFKPDEENSNSPVFDLDGFMEEYGDKIWQTNFGSIYQPQKVLQAFKRFKDKKEGNYHDDGIPWEKIFQLPKDVSADSATGKYLAELGDLHVKFRRGDIIGLSDDKVTELRTLREAMANEVYQDVLKHPEFKGRYKAEAEQRIKKYGGNIPANIARFGLTESSMLLNPVDDETKAWIEEKFTEDEYSKIFAQPNKEFVIDTSNANSNAEKLQQAKAHKEAILKEYEETQKKVDELRKLSIEKKITPEQDDELAKLDDKAVNLLLSSDTFDRIITSMENLSSMSGKGNSVGSLHLLDEYRRVSDGAHSTQSDFWNIIFKAKKNEKGLGERDDYAAELYDYYSGRAAKQVENIDTLINQYQQAGIPIDPVIQADLEDLQANLPRMANSAFVAKGFTTAKNTFVDLHDIREKTETPPDKQKEYLDGLIEKIRNAENYSKQIDEICKKNPDNKGFLERQAQTKEFIEQAYGELDGIKDILTDENAKFFSKNIGTLSNQVYSTIDPVRDFKNKALVNQERIKALRNQLEQRRKAGVVSDEDYARFSSDLDDLASHATAGTEALNQMGNAVIRVGAMFSRRLFRQAVNEVKKFVQEFDAAMTEIQTVTLKTDDQIEELGDTLLKKAVDLKTSVSSITNTATALYRQGLSDEEVNERLDEIVKFSKVTKVKPEDATKLITVAMNSGMVKSSSEAMDVITALGDSAATTAGEITKGMQKSIYAAKEAGVTYQQLVAMLTAITSKTQLSGTTAGTTLQTIFSRMNRITSEGDMFVDEDGNQVNMSDVAAALRNIGVDYTDRKTGKKRGDYYILSDLGKKWGDIDESQKSYIANLLAGTRQYSNFAALMQAFGSVDANGNSEMDRFLKIGNESAGITDEKNEVRMKSLAASMDLVRTSFDQLVNSMSNTEFATGFLDFLSTGIQGLTNFNNALGGIPGQFLIASTAALAFISLITKLEKTSVILGAIGLGIGAISAIGNYMEAQKGPSVDEIVASASKDNQARSEAIAKAKAYNVRQQNGEKLSDADMSAYKESLRNLAALGLITLDASTSIDELARNAAKAGSALGIVEENAKKRSRFDFISAYNSEIESSTDYVKEWNAKKGADNWSLYDSNDAEKAKSAITYIFDADSTSKDNGYLKTIVLDALNTEFLPDNTLMHIKDTYGKETASQIASLVSMYSAYSQNGIFDSIPWDETKTTEENYKILLGYMNELLSPDSFSGFGDSKREEIKSILALSPDLDDAIVDTLTDALVQEINQNPEQYGSILSGLIDEEKHYVTATSAEAYLQGKDMSNTVTTSKESEGVNSSNPNAYSIATNRKKDNNKQFADDLYTKFTDANVFISYLNDLNNDESQSERNKFKSILDSDPELAQAIESLYNVGENGTATLDDERAEFLYPVIRSMIASDSQNYTTLGTAKSAGAKEAKLAGIFTKITSATDRSSAYAKLSDIDSENSEQQKSLIDFFGEETVKQLVDGTLSPESEQYLLQEITASATGAQARSNQATAIRAKALLDGRNTENFSAYELDKIYKQYGDLSTYLLYTDQDGKINDAGRKAGYTQTMFDSMRSALDQSLSVDSIDVKRDSQEFVSELMSAFAGTTSDQFSGYAKAVSEYNNAGTARYYANQLQSGILTSDNIGGVANYLGLDEATVAKMASTEEGRKTLSEMVVKNADVVMHGLSDALTLMIQDADITDKNLDTTALSERLSKMGNDLLAEVVSTVGAAIENGKVSIDEDGVSSNQDFRSIFGTKVANFNQSKSKSAINALISAVEAENPEDISRVLSGNSDIDWTALDDNVFAWLDAYQHGDIGKEQIQEYLNNYSKYGAEKTTDYYASPLSALLGKNFASTLEKASNGSLSDKELANIQQNYRDMNESPFGQLQLEELSGLDGMNELFAVLAENENDVTTNAEKMKQGLKNVNTSFSSKQLSETMAYNKALDETVSIFNDIAKGGKDAASAYNKLYDESRNVAYARDALSKYKSGNRSDNVTSLLSSYFNIDQKDLKKATKKEAALWTQNMEQSLEDSTEQLETNLSTNLSTVLDNMIDDAQARGTAIDVGNFVMSGRVDTSGILSAFTSAGVVVDQAWIALVNALTNLGATFSIGADGNTIKVDLGEAKKSGYRGSGGSKKSAADKLIAKQKEGGTLYDHQIKMVQYEETKYQNASELTNYGKMLQEEIKLEKSYLPVLESNISALKAQLDQTKTGSEDWYKLRDAILDAEEKYSDITNTIADNTKKLEENEQAILKLHTDLESAVVDEIEARIQSELDQLNGTVSMQNTVLEAIKQRYRDEWDLIKKDIQKKKDALEEEKSLIDERLQKRKDAEDEAEKYEELAEYKKQLALIEMDSTRTKDAAALRKKITDLEKDIAWDIADQEAEDAKNQISDQINAYDDYVSEGDEDLDDMLNDATNFAEEVNGVMKLNQSELFDWLKNNVKEYSNSLEAAQKQMVQSWTDTYKQMMGIVDTYWGQVDRVLGSKDSFLEYMKNSSDYINASTDDQKQKLYEWGKMYDDWVSARKNTASWNHGDPGLGDWSASEYTGSSSGSGGSGSGSGGNGSDATPSSGGKPTNTGYFIAKTHDGKVIFEGKAYATVASAAKSYADKNGSRTIVVDSSGKVMTTYSGSTTSSGKPWFVTINGKKVGAGVATEEEVKKLAARYLKTGNYQSTDISYKKFKRGGIADFTGPAWLDGTPTKPERILNAEQTTLFDNAVSALQSMASISPTILSDMVNWSKFAPAIGSFFGVDTSNFGQKNVTVGDVNVTINKAEINDDRSIDELAERVGSAFAKNLTKQGLHIANYAF